MIIGTIARSIAPDAISHAALPHEICSPCAWPVGHVCEFVVSSPFVTAVTLGDVVCLWFITCILLRASAQTAEQKSAKQALPKNVRTRRSWGVLRTALQLASAKREASGGTWAAAWQGVGKARGERKSHMLKLDFNLAGVTTRAIGPVFVCSMVSLILVEVHAFFTLALPLYELAGWRLRAAQLMGAFVSGRILMNYARASLTDPGSPAPVSPGGPVAQNTPDPEHAIRTLKKDPLWCGTCKGPKPARAHHCKTCRKCVLKMDHHCPFVSNCIGQRNYSYFCLFLLDLTVGSFILALAISPAVPVAIIELYFDASLEGAKWSRYVYVVSVFSVATGAMCFVGSLFAYHLHLIAIGQTTLEQMKRKAGKAGLRDEGLPYSLKGFSAVFGTPPPFLEGLVKKGLRLMASIG